MIPALYPHLTWSDFTAFAYIGKDCSEAFTKKLSEKFKSRYSLTYASGRAGIYHILKANKIQNKSILVTAYTCSVVTEAIVQSGNTPVFVDTTKGSFNAEITEAEIKKHNPDLGAVIITNLYGIDDFSDLDFLKKNKEFLVILDDALSPGHVPQRPAGIYDYVEISCGVRKPFSCLGGGIIFTDNETRFKILEDYTLKNRTDMKPWKKFKKYFLCFLFFFAFRPVLYSFTSFIRRRTTLLNAFFNERYHDIHQERPEYFEDMCDFQKRIGLNQLKRFDNLLRRRREIGNIYYKLLSPTFTQVKNYWRTDTFYSHIPFLYPDRDGMERYLLKNGIDVERYFDYIVPGLPQYNVKEKFPNAEYISEQIMNLPINMGLNEKSISKIVDRINRFDASRKE